jgi:hypothetical protein
MKILIRANGKRKWELVHSVETKAELELQKLLIESPSLIPVDEIRKNIPPLVVAVDEFGPFCGFLPVLNSSQVL